MEEVAAAMVAEAEVDTAVEELVVTACPTSALVCKSKAGVS